MRVLDSAQDQTDVVRDDQLDKADPPPENDAVAVAGRQRETHMGFIRSLATIVFVIALPVAILTTNIRVLLNAPLVYDYAFDRYNAEETTGLSRADLDACGAELREYFNNSEPTYYCTVTENGLPTPIFSARETLHMEDVKDLVVWVNWLQMISVMFIVAYGVVFFVWSREGNLRQLAGQCLAGLLLGFIAVGAVGAVVREGQPDRPDQREDVDRQQQHDCRRDEPPGERPVRHTAQAPNQLLRRGARRAVGKADAVGDVVHL